MGKIEDKILEQLKPEERKMLFVFGILVSVVLLLFAGTKLIKQTKCNNEGGIFMEDGSCYKPNDIYEKAAIIDKGYIEWGETTNYTPSFFLINISPKIY